MQVARVQLPPLARIVVLGDSAHTIDPARAGGLTLLLTKVELLRDFYLPRWLQKDTAQPPEIQAFYADPRRARAMKHVFAGGRYILALNHDESGRGTWRRTSFALQHTAAAWRARQAARPDARTGPPWPLPAPYRYEQ